MTTPITFTGVDEWTDVYRLGDVAEKYGGPPGDDGYRPDVEFAVLVGSQTPLQGSSSPAPRFPPLPIVRDLARVGRGAGFRTAVHFCGRYSRDINVGRFDQALEVAREFGRIQVNGVRYNMTAIGNFARRAGVEVVCQWRGQSQPRYPGVVFLHDASGGRGIERIDQWPAPVRGERVGYAGGLSPENIERALRFTSHFPHSDVWLDMETGVRNDRDRFDTGLVENVLTTAAAAGETW